jgi:hypothetical protein
MSGIAYISNRVLSPGLVAGSGWEARFGPTAEVGIAPLPILAAYPVGPGVPSHRGVMPGLRSYRSPSISVMIAT